MQLQYISSRSNPCVKWAATLSDRKGRRESASFLIDGEKLFLEACACSLPITHVFIAASAKERYIPLLDKLPGTALAPLCCVLADDCFCKISAEKAPQGIITVIKNLDNFKRCIKIYKDDLLKDPHRRMLFLSSVQDPGNLGAVIRSAAAFGVEHLILTADCADPYNPKVLRAAMGSLFHVAITVVEDAEATVLALREVGRSVYAAELTDRACSVLVSPPGKQDILIIGNEGHGIDPALSALCDGSVYIPISPHIESLNAAVAASVLLWEQSRR